MKQGNQSMIFSILSKCDERYKNNQECISDYFDRSDCFFDCDQCLRQIHNPDLLPPDVPVRNYDCKVMADFYACKYSYKYTSEMIYALRRLDELRKKTGLKVLSFGCGPCTDLFALDQMIKSGELACHNIEYRGIDYNEDVWKQIHRDILSLDERYYDIRYYYIDMCDFIDIIAHWTWIPDLIVFQYVFSDMQKHTGLRKTVQFIERFSSYWNERILSGSFTIINDTNLTTGFDGGRDYFDILAERLSASTVMKGYFHNVNSISSNPGGNPYGEKFPKNANLFDITQWSEYKPINNCSSAQMVIERKAEI